MSGAVCDDQDGQRGVSEMNETQITGYRYADARAGHHHAYLLPSEAGFVDIHFERVGRVPALAKAMVAIARKP